MANLHERQKLLHEPQTGKESLFFNKLHNHISLSTSHYRNITKTKHHQYQKQHRKSIQNQRHGTTQTFFVQFEVKDQCIQLNQTNYIDNILEKFNMNNCKLVNTPMMLHDKKLLEKENKNDPTTFPYQEVIGSLIYLTTISRPDICRQ